MLSRALLRSVRGVSALPTSSSRIVPVSARIPSSQIPLQATSTIWARGMANSNKPKDQSQPSQNEKSPEKSSQSKQSSEQPAKSEQTEKPAESEPTPDFNSLPDLTQGIPSTFFEEMEQKQKNKDVAEDQKPGEEAAEGERPRPKGEMPASAYETSTDRRRAKMANRMYLLSLVAAVGGIAYLGRDWDAEEAEIHTEIPNGWTPALWWKRAKARQGDVLSYYHEPAFEKLLPDVNPVFERPYTLCISMSDMLVHSEWTRDHGWRVAKRPGVDYFIRYLSQYYELVLFTDIPAAMAEPVMRKLDPFRFIVWPLFREHTKFVDGEVVKDLSYLNRDLSKVIIIDSKSSHVRNQPENAIVLNPWKGDAKDTELVSLIPFLEYIHTMQYEDVRKVLKSFSGKHIPTEFARREAIARAEFNKKYEAKKASRHSGMGALGSMLGMKPSNMSMMVPAEGEQSQAEAFAQGKMLQDIARERGQRNYELMDREIRANGEKWLKEDQELQEAAQAEMMSSMKSSFSGWFPSFGSSDDSSSNEGKK